MAPTHPDCVNIFTIRWDVCGTCPPTTMPEYSRIARATLVWYADPSLPTISPDRFFQPMGVYGTSTFFQGEPVTPPAHPAPSSSLCTSLSTIGNLAASTSTASTASGTSAAVSASSSSGSASHSGSSSGSASASRSGSGSVSSTSSSAPSGGASSSAPVSPSSMLESPFELSLRRQHTFICYASNALPVQNSILTKPPFAERIVLRRHPDIRLDFGIRLRYRWYRN